MKVIFNKPYITGKEQTYIDDLISNHTKLSGDGYYSKKVSNMIEQTFGVNKALLVSSCSSALEMACIIADVQQGDEVILPSYAFVSTANAVVLRGAKCVFAEIDEYCNIDLDDVEKKITERTKIVIPVHYAGVSCDMDRLMELSAKYGFMVVEDAAQAVNAKYKGRYLGTIGHIGCYSFHDTKNYVCGEGGAILINTDDENIISRSEIIWEKGTDRSSFFRGEIDKYSWMDIGSSFLMSEIQSAFLLSQLENVDKINELRKKIYVSYKNGLEILEQKGILKLCAIPAYNDANYHMFYLILKSEERRDSLMNYLKEHEIFAVFHYVPLHSSKMGMRLGNRQGDLPITEKTSKCILRLPLYADMKKQEIEYVIERILSYFDF